MTEYGRDFIVTWPKSRPLGSYLDELRKAEAAGQQINYRLPSRPAIDSLVHPTGRRIRCYMLYDSLIRGFNNIQAIAYREVGEVARVRSDAMSGYWPAGNYLVRSPVWHPVEPIEMRGFRGYRFWPPEMALPPARVLV